MAKLTIMKRIKFLFALLGFTLFACQSGDRNIVFDEKANQEILYGYATLEVFSSEPFAVWYGNEYANYEPDGLLVDSLANLIEDVKVTVILGTWCMDSKRELPRFIKILNNINFPMEHLTIIGVNRDKICPKANVHKGEVELVPTFIIFKKGMEVGRIVESPALSLERDLLEILKES